MTLDELAASHAELSETVAAMRAQMEALAQQIANLPAPQITVTPQVNVPPQAAPNVIVQAAAPAAPECDFEITTYDGMGNAAKSIIRRVPKDKT